jgi:hypothetical protein
MPATWVNQQSDDVPVFYKWVARPAKNQQVGLVWAVFVSADNQFARRPI